MRCCADKLSRQEEGRDSTPSVPMGEAQNIQMGQAPKNENKEFYIKKDFERAFLHLLIENQ